MNQEAIDKKDAWIIERDRIVNERAAKFHSGINVVVTAHAEQRIFMQACLESVKDFGHVLVVYDNPAGRYDTHLPDPEMFKLIDSFIMKHPTREHPGPTYPQFWNFKHAADFLYGSKAEYVFVIGADSILERPEGIKEIKDMLGESDLISCSTKNPTRHSGVYCNSKSFLIKKISFIKLMEFIEQTFIPFDKQYGNMESRFGLAIKDLMLDEVVVPELPLEDQFAHAYDDKDNCIQRGTWGDVLGYRHLGGEHKIRRMQKRIPIEEKYFGMKYLRSQEKFLLPWWKENKQESLEAWWKT